MTDTGANYFPPCTSTNCQVNETERQQVQRERDAAARPPCALTERCVASCAAYGRICPCSARIAAHYACNAIHNLQKNSRLFTSNPQDSNNNTDDENEIEGKPNFPYLDANDILIGEKLGEGGFSNVNVCTITKGKDAGKQFAVKYLKKRAMVDLHQFKHGAADLSVEAL